MSIEKCPICCGSQKIRLPVYRDVPVTYDYSGLSSMEESYRTYACPECTPKVDDTEVIVFHACNRISKMTVDQSNGEAVHHVRRSMSAAIDERLIREGFIQFSEKQDDDDLYVEITASIGVVSVTTIEQRRTDLKEAFDKHIAESRSA